MQPSHASPGGTKRRSPDSFSTQRNLAIGVAAIMLLVLVVFFVRANNRPSLDNITGVDPTNTELVEAGQRIYATRCAGCHSANLAGQARWSAGNGLLASPLNATGPSPQRTDGWLFTTIKQGGQATAPPGAVNAMPAFGGALSDAEIWAVISFMESTWPPDVQGAQP